MLSESKKSRKHYGLSYHTACKDYIKTFTCMTACKSIGYQIFRLDFTCKCKCHELKTTTVLPFFKWRTNGTTRKWGRTSSPSLYNIAGTLSPRTYPDYEDIINNFTSPAINITQSESLNITTSSGENTTVSALNINETSLSTLEMTSWAEFSEWLDINGTQSTLILRYGHQQTHKCNDFEKAFNCIQTCLYRGFQIARSNEKCQCFCIKDEKKAKRQFNPINTRRRQFNPINTRRRQFSPINTRRRQFNPINTRKRQFNPINTRRRQFNPINTRRRQFNPINTRKRQFNPINTRRRQFNPINTRRRQFNPINTRKRQFNPINTRRRQFNPINTRRRQFNPINTRKRQFNPINTRRRQFNPINTRRRQFNPINTRKRQFNPINTRKRQFNPINTRRRQFNPINTRKRQFNPINTRKRQFNPINTRKRQFNSIITRRRQFNPINTRRRHTELNRTPNTNSGQSKNATYVTQEYNDDNNNIIHTEDKLNVKFDSYIRSYEIQMLYERNNLGLVIKMRVISGFV
ncbi:hypothetical protein HW555_006795 [Spodoptera exigua]|uniref:Uncharacterized protein n=1 Tax=Spodoptera exigua TaxID=7107 RepID=A0A835L501_SPOEX|nr:hypothetical protein HW555_006795 [Spodoptera exigua]